MPRTVNSLQIPLPMQSSYMRLYASKNNFNFILPNVEICFKESYYVLRCLIEKIPEGSHFCTSTIYFFPFSDKSIFNSIKNEIASKNLICHFPLENFIYSPLDFNNLRVFQS